MVFEAEYSKETPGTYRYAEDAEPEKQISGSIYLRKGPLDGFKPKRLEVTVRVIS
jgi:hypothetical protein